MNVYLAGAVNRQLDELLHACGFHTTHCSLEDLSGFAAQATFQGDVVLLDLRDRGSVPPAVAPFTRQHTQTGVVIVGASLDPHLMLEAMRAGVSEFVAEPVQQSELRAAIERVAAKRPVPEAGKVFAFIGGKGGVGTTTLAVNAAAAMAKAAASSALVIDLHVLYGDAALFLGVEPRFSVADALENIHRLDEAFLRSLVGRTKFGLDLLASSDRAIVGPIDVRAVRAVIECAARHYAYVVLDVPRADSIMLDALEMTTKIVVVANQELATIRSASRMAAALRQRYGKDKVEVVVSRYDQVAEIGKSEIERAMGGAVTQVFPSNYRMALGALNLGRPLILDNHNKLAGSFERFARSLAGLAPQGAAAVPAEAEEPAAERPAGLFGKLGLGLRT
jgi:pilus assembly protein CpaE